MNLKEILTYLDAEPGPGLTLVVFALMAAVLIFGLILNWAVEM